MQCIFKYKGKIRKEKNETPSINEQTNFIFFNKYLNYLYSIVLKIININWFYKTLNIINIKFNFKKLINYRIIIILLKYENTNAKNVNFIKFCNDSPII